MVAFKIIKLYEVNSVSIVEPDLQIGSSIEEFVEQYIDFQKDLLVVIAMHMGNAIFVDYKTIDFLENLILFISVLFDWELFVN